MGVRQFRGAGIEGSVYLTAWLPQGLEAMLECTLIPVTQPIRVATDYRLARPEATIRAVQCAVGCFDAILQFPVTPGRAPKLPGRVQKLHCERQGPSRV